MGKLQLDMRALMVGSCSKELCEQCVCRCPTAPRAGSKALEEQPPKFQCGMAIAVLWKVTRLAQSQCPSCSPTAEHPPLLCSARHTLALFWNYSRPTHSRGHHPLQPCSALSQRARYQSLMPRQQGWWIAL
eukprot:3521687-Rhodomonas_salina.1